MRIRERVPETALWESGGSSATIRRRSALLKQGGRVGNRLERPVSGAGVLSSVLTFLPRTAPMRFRLLLWGSLGWKPGGKKRRLFRTGEPGPILGETGSDHSGLHALLLHEKIVEEGGLAEERVAEGLAQVRVQRVRELEESVKRRRSRVEEEWCRLLELPAVDVEVKEAGESPHAREVTGRERARLEDLVRGKGVPDHAEGLIVPDDRSPAQSFQDADLDLVRGQRVERVKTPTKARKIVARKPDDEVGVQVHSGFVLQPLEILFGAPPMLTPRDARVHSLIERLYADLELDGARREPKDALLQRVRQAVWNQLEVEEHAGDIAVGEEVENCGRHLDVEVECPIDELERLGAAGEQVLEGLEEGVERKRPYRDVERRKAEFALIGTATGSLNVDDAMGEVVVGVFTVGEAEPSQIGCTRVDERRGHAASLEDVSAEFCKCEVGLAGDDVVHDPGDLEIGGFVTDFGASGDEAESGTEAFQNARDLGQGRDVPDVDGEPDDPRVLFDDGGGDIQGMAAGLELENRALFTELREIGPEVANPERSVRVARIEGAEDDVGHAGNLPSGAPSPKPLRGPSSETGLRIRSPRRRIVAMFLLRPLAFLVVLAVATLPGQPIADDVVWIHSGQALRAYSTRTGAILAGTLPALSNGCHSAALDGQRNLWVSDQSGGSNVVRRFDPTGVLVGAYVAGVVVPGGTSSVGPLAIDRLGFVYVGDPRPTGTTVTKLDSAGTLVTSWTVAGLSVRSIAVDPVGDLWVVSFSATTTGYLQKFTSSGQELVRIGAGTSSAAPNAVFCDEFGRVTISHYPFPSAYRRFNSAGSALGGFDGGNPAPGNPSVGAIVVGLDGKVWSSQPFLTDLETSYPGSPGVSSFIRDVGIGATGLHFDAEGDLWAFSFNPQASSSVIAREFSSAGTPKLAFSVGPVGLFGSSLNLGDPTGMVRARVVDPDGDLDLDSVPNRQELLAGASPMLASSVPLQFTQLSPPLLGTVFQLRLSGPTQALRPYFAPFSFNPSGTPLSLLAQHDVRLFGCGWSDLATPSMVDPLWALSAHGSPEGLSIFPDTFGTLNASGQATIRVFLPFVPALSGALVYTSAATLDASASAGIFALSQLYPVTLQ